MLKTEKREYTFWPFWDKRWNHESCKGGIKMVSNGGKFEMQLHKVPQIVEEHEFFKKYFQKMVLVIFILKLKIMFKKPSGTGASLRLSAFI